MRTGYRMTVRATYHQDLLLPLISNLLPKDAERAPDAGRRGHDGHQLMAHDPARPGARHGAPASAARSSSSSCCRSRRSSRRPASPIDIGRLYMERRFLENAADAAALAAANSLIRGNTDADARSDAMAVLTKNFAAPPNGIVPSLPPAAGAEVYESGHAGDAAYLIDGILINGGDVRVAVRNTIGVHVRPRGRPDTRSSWSAARGSGSNGDALPIAVRHYINAPGPDDRRDGAVRRRHARLPGPRVDGEHGLPRHREQRLAAHRRPRPASRSIASNPNNDPAHHGPIINLVGQGAQPVEQLELPGVHRARHPELPVGDVQRVLQRRHGRHQREHAQGVRGRRGWPPGYPGPAFPPVTSPPDPDDQVGIIDGNSSGIIIDAIDEPLRPRRGGPRGRLLRHGHDDPRLRAHGPLDRSPSARPRTATARSR